MLVNFLSRLCLCLLFLVGSIAYARPISFDLENTQGRVTQADFPDKYILLALGYTSCPDICPTTLYEFAATLKQLKKPEAITPVFVSIDPVHDTAETMQSYAHYFDKRIVGLTGSMEQIKNLTNQLGATFGYRLNGKKVDLPTKGSGYTVYHSSLIYLINPKHELVDVFDYQIGADDLAAAINKVVAVTPSDTSHHAVANTRNNAALPVADATTSSHNTPPAADARAHTQNTPSGAAAQQAHDSNGATKTEDCPLPKGFTPLRQDIALKDIYPNPSTQKVELLNLWATWCAPCRIELPILDKFTQNTQELAIHTLNLGDNQTKIEELFQHNNIHHLAKYSVEGTRLLKQLGGKGLPFNALFVNGKQIAIKHGIIEETDSLTAFAQCVNKQNK
ncbi:SCO family protein [Pelistega europaea]|uniref:Thioredoxin domain-containing protein n=1 Tax=Pelistega europaea TaxID=106147 RepID=A0A7Y4P528_9BURK|nr:SCO family protein [Pelistega europaea]NOL50101.1 hypothetical protein [Pelistega europaea]